MALAQPSGSSQEDALGEECLARLVLDYLAKHPQAMDTAEGIAEWWMHDQAGVNAETLQRVLRRLTERGVLLEIPGAAEVRFALRH